jgi:hypothetical protein
MLHFPYILHTVSKFAHSIKSAVLNLSSSTLFLFPLDSGFNTHRLVDFPKWSIHSYLLSPRSLCHKSLSRSPAHYALTSLLLLPQSDCYHFDFGRLLVPPLLRVSLNEVPDHERQTRTFHWQITRDPTMCGQSLLLLSSTSTQRTNRLTD